MVGDINAGYHTTLFLSKRKWWCTKSSMILFLVWKTSHTLLIDKFSADSIQHVFLSWFCLIESFTHDFRWVLPTASAFTQTSWPLVKCMKSLKEMKNSILNILSNFKTSLFWKLQLLKTFFSEVYGQAGLFLTESTSLLLWWSQLICLHIQEFSTELNQFSKKLH